VAIVVAACLTTSLGAAENGERELGRMKIKPLDETSGVAASRQNSDTVWLHNDGEAEHVYAAKTSGAIAAQVRVSAAIEDLEDIAIGPGRAGDGDDLYLGDIGDNDGRRREVRVHRFKEPRLESVAQLTVSDVQTFRLAYPDGPVDAEALMVDPQAGDILIATKEEGGARIYFAPAQALSGAGQVELTRLAVLNVANVSGGDISPDGRLLAMRSEDEGWLWERQSGESWQTTLARAPIEIPVLGRDQSDNGEAIAFTADSATYLTISEGKKQRLYQFAVPKPVRLGDR
jgi:hypothetical protein